jgi:copper chaperone CopZ
MRYILFFSILFAMACKSPNPKQELNSSLPEVSQSAEFIVEGMTCAGCENTIQSNVSKLNGVYTVKASHTEGKAKIDYNPEKTDTNKIKQSITESGYTVVSVSLIEQ